MHVVHMCMCMCVHVHYLSVYVCMCVHIQTMSYCINCRESQESLVLLVVMDEQEMRGLSVILDVPGLLVHLESQ